MTSITSSKITDVRTYIPEPTRLVPIEVPPFKLKDGGKAQVDAEFKRLHMWSVDRQALLGRSMHFLQQRVVSDDTVVHYTLELSLLPNNQVPRQYFSVLVDFEKSTVAVEYEFDASANISAEFGQRRRPYEFKCLDHLNKTVACFARFQEFVASICE